MTLPLGMSNDARLVETGATPPRQALTLQEHACRIVHNYVVARLEKTDPYVEFDVYCVWFTKTLEHWKAMVSTSLPDGRYYEVTHNGIKKETYVDNYVKVDNVTIPDTANDF